MTPSRNLSTPENARVFERPDSVVSRQSGMALELDLVLKVLSAFASSDLGALTVLSLAPFSKVAAVYRARDLVDEVGRLWEQEGALLTSKEVDWVEPLERLRDDRGIDTGQLLALAALLESFGAAQRRLGRETSPLLFEELHLSLEGGSALEAVPLDQRPERVGLAADLAERVRSVLDPHGNVRSDATPKLASLTAAVRRTRERLYSSFQSYAKDNQAVLGDDTVTRAEGRLAVLLPAGHRGRLSGIVRGRSGTAKSYYFEPLELVEDNNRLQESQNREEAERARVLRELAGLFQENSELVCQIGRFVGKLDGWQAAHRFRVQIKGQWPALDVDEEATWNVHGAKHPLLDPRLQGLRESQLGSSGHSGEVVPLDIEAGNNRVLVITGPNAGGKTVALKTLGVLSYLASCGWPVPLAEPTAEKSESRLPLFRQWIAVVGDEQDVLAERSTFSARLERLSEVWDAAGPGALVLLDEVGSGTNPEEGAALTIALLERLVERGCFAVMTTHLLQVANAALALPGCASLAMELDSASGAPTFRIRTGTPGSSHALDLARRLGLADAWVDRAEELLGEDQLTLRHLIAETESARQQAVEIESELETLRANQETLQRRQEEELTNAREERLEARKKAQSELEQFRRSARDELAREVQKTRTEAKKAEVRRKAGGAAQGGSRGAAPLGGAELPSPRSASKEAARRVARMVAGSPLAASLAQSIDEPSEAKPLVVGDAVRHRALGWTGRIDKLLGASKSGVSKTGASKSGASKKGQKVEVLVRGKRVRCGLDELMEDATATRGKGTGGRTVGVKGTPPGFVRKASTVTVNASSSTLGAELMLVGQRVAPALDRLDTYLDQALVGNLEQVRVVHGFGSGRLREAVRELLRAHPLVAKVEPAPAELGGDGATVVTFRD